MTTFHSYLAPGGYQPGTAYTIVLPAGLPLLSSNQRLHFHKHARRTRMLRDAACLSLRGMPAFRRARLAADPDPVLHRAHIIGVLHPTDRTRRDPANWYPSFKACVDGLVDAGLLADDDHRHVIGPDMRIGPPIKGGQLALHIRELAAEVTP